MAIGREYQYLQYGESKCRLHNLFMIAYGRRDGRPYRIGLDHALGREVAYDRHAQAPDCSGVCAFNITFQTFIISTPHGAGSSVTERGSPAVLQPVSSTPTGQPGLTWQVPRHQSFVDTHSMLLAATNSN